MCEVLGYIVTKRLKHHRTSSSIITIILIIHHHHHYHHHHVQAAIEDQACYTRKLWQLIDDHHVITQAYAKGKTRSQKKRKAVEAAPEHLKGTEVRDGLASLPRLEVGRDDDDDDDERLTVAEYVCEGKVPRDVYVEHFEMMTPVVDDLALGREG